VNERTSNGSNLKILVADDSPVNQAVAKGLLELQGHTVHLAGTGREAFEVCRGEAFDVILMDLEMPEMDGLTATRRIRELDGNANVATPIIALTAHEADDVRARCVEAGMQAVVCKPLQPRELFAVLESLAATSAEPMAC
jgi:CheY-like chemotaxis protein